MMKLLLSQYKILLLVWLFLWNCRGLGLGNLCDPKADGFLATLLLRGNANDTSSFCGSPLAGTSTEIYVVGFKRITASNTHWWIKKFSEDGIEDLTWNKSFDGGSLGSNEAYSCSVDPNGNVYVAGLRTVAGSGENWWIKKYDADGIEDTIQWNKSFDGGANDSDIAFKIKLDPAGNVFVVGRRYQSSSAQDWWIKKYSPLGIEDTLNWNLSLNGPSNVTDDAKDITFASDGSVYVVGEMEVPGNFQNMWIKKFNAIGIEDTANWNLSFNGSASLNDIFENVLVDPSGNVYVSGIINESLGAENWNIRKFNSLGVGDVLFGNKSLDGGTNDADLLRSMAFDRFGNLYVGGRMQYTTGNSTWSIRKFTPDGVEFPNYSIRFDLESSFLDDAFAMTIDAKNNLYAAGLCRNSTTNEDWCIKKYDSSGEEITTGWNKQYDGGIGLDEFPRGICVRNRGFL